MKRPALFAAAAAILLVNLTWSTEDNLLQGTLFSGGAPSTASDPLLASAKWINDNAPEDAVLITSAGGLFYYVHTGRAACPYETLGISPADHMETMYGLSRKSPDFPTVRDQIAEASPGSPQYRVEVLRGTDHLDSDSLTAEWDAVFLDEPGVTAVVISRLPDKDAAVLPHD